MSAGNTLALDEWRQGDLILSPLELPALFLDAGEMAIETIKADHGVALVSQSCDVIRDVILRPYVQVSPLVRVSADELRRLKKGQSPTRITLASLESLHLAVDLEAVATVHKALLSEWIRTPGCQGDEERRFFAQSLGRHRFRFAFPDDFNSGVKPFRTWVEQKWKKASQHGDMVRATREVRVSCEDWDCPDAIIFWILLDELPDNATLQEWRALAKDLERKLATSLADPEVKIVTYDQISARDYVNSDRLDWDALSDS